MGSRWIAKILWSISFSVCLHSYFQFYSSSDFLLWFLARLQVLKLSVPQSTLSCFYPARAQTGVSPEKWPLAQKKIQNPKKSFQEKGPLSNSRWCWVFVFPVERESFPEVQIRIETGIGLLSRDMPLAVEPPLLRFGAPSIHLDFYWKLFFGTPCPCKWKLTPAGKRHACNK